MIPVAVVLFGAAVGALNGALVNYGRYQAVVATLCMNFILSGFALGYAPSPVSGTTGWLTSLGSTVGGVPGGLILIAVPLLAWFGPGPHARSCGRCAPSAAARPPRTPRA